MNPKNIIYAINSTLNVDSMKNYAEQLSRLKIPSIFPSSLMRKIISLSQLLIGNIYEINQVKIRTNMSERDLLEFLSGIIITKGKEGSEIIYKNHLGKIIHLNVITPIPKVVLDTTGAGDGYRAGLLSGKYIGLSLLDSCKVGSVISSFVVETLGAQTQIFTMKDIKKRFKETYGYTPSEL